MKEGFNPGRGKRSCWKLNKNPFTFSWVGEDSAKYEASFFDTDNKRGFTDVAGWLSDSPVFESQTYDMGPQHWQRRSVKPSEAPWAYKIDGFLFQAKHVINMSARFGRLENVFGNKRLWNFHSADASSLFHYIFIFICIVLFLMWTFLC